MLTFGGELVAGRGTATATAAASRCGDQASRLGHRGRHRRGVLAGLAGTLRAQPRLTLGRRRAAQRIRPSANGIRAFLGGAHRQPGLDLGGAGGLGGRRRLLAVDRLGVERRLLLRVVQPLSRAR